MTTDADDGTKTDDDVIEEATEADVKFVHLQFSDITGLGKNVTIPIERLEEVLDSGVQFDGSSIIGYTPIEESDMVLQPDPSTFAVLPWSKQNGALAAQIVCDVFRPDGERFMGDPRYALQRAMAKAEEMGFTFNTGPECEFFLFRIDDDGNPTTIPHDRGGYFDLTPTDWGEVVRNDVTGYLEHLGFDVEASHHEVAPGQHEIDFNYADALTTADRVMTLKYATKVVGLKHDLHATFIPKPLVGENGSGMHTHQSLMTADGEPAFYEEGAEWDLSKTALNYLGGMLTYVPEVTAVLNSTVNSYKRLVPGYEAPCYVSWANKNRSALVRVPAARGKGTRLELRSPDPAGNPYLQFAVMLEMGLRGIEEGLTPPSPVERDIYHLTAEERAKFEIGELPGNLSDALDLLETSEVAKEALGEHVHREFLTVKRAEWDDYRTKVSPWELDQYLPLY